MKRQPNRPATIDAGCRAIANHANGNLAHDVIRRLAPGGLEQAKDSDTMVRHDIERVLVAESIRRVQEIRMGNYGRVVVVPDLLIFVPRAGPWHPRRASKAR